MPKGRWGHPLKETLVLAPSHTQSIGMCTALSFRPLARRIQATLPDALINVTSYIPYYRKVFNVSKCRGFTAVYQSTLMGYFQAMVLNKTMNKLYLSEI